MKGDHRRVSAEDRSDRGRKAAKSRAKRGFTLIEIMVVVGIAAVLLSMAIPAFVTRLSQQSMQRAVSDILQLLWRARADAILSGSPTRVEIRPGEGSFRVMRIETTASRSAEDEGLDATGIGDASTVAQGHRETSGNAADRLGGDRNKKLDPAIQILLLGIDGEDWSEDEVASIRFFPNGTCDELSLVLISDKMEQKNIWLEVVTGLADVEVDPKKFRELSGNE